MRMEARAAHSLHLPYDPKSPKKPTNLSINSDLLQKTREMGVNLSAELEKALVEILNQRQREQWLAENQEAITTYNDHVARNGVWSEGLRSF